MTACLLKCQFHQSALTSISKLGHPIAWITSPPQHHQALAKSKPTSLMQPSRPWNQGWTAATSLGACAKDGNVVVGERNRFTHVFPRLDLDTLKPPSLRLFVHPLEPIQSPFRHHYWTPAPGLEVQLPHADPHTRRASPDWGARNVDVGAFGIRPLFGRSVRSQPPAGGCGGSPVPPCVSSIHVKS